MKHTVTIESPHSVHTCVILELAEIELTEGDTIADPEALKIFFGIFLGSLFHNDVFGMPHLMGNCSKDGHLLDNWKHVADLMAMSADRIKEGVEAALCADLPGKQ